MPKGDVWFHEEGGADMAEKLLTNSLPASQLRSPGQMYRTPLLFTLHLLDALGRGWQVFRKRCPCSLNRLSHLAPHLVVCAMSLLFLLDLLAFKLLSRQAGKEHSVKPSFGS